MFQGCSHSHPNFDSLYCNGFCLPWACTTILLSVNGCQVNFKCAFLLSSACRGSLLFIFHCCAASLLFYFNYWDVTYVLVSSLLQIPSVLFYFSLLQGLRGKNCIMSFMYSHTSPRNWIEQESDWDFNVVTCWSH